MSLVVSSIVPTSAGRIVFARPEDDAAPRATPARRRADAEPTPRPSRAVTVAPVLSGCRPGRSSSPRVAARASAGRSSSASLGDRRLVDHAVAARARRATPWCSSCLPTAGGTCDGSCDRSPAAPPGRRRCAPGSPRSPTELEIVVVHDAARPLADVRVFDRVVGAVREGADGAVPGVPVADTIKRVDRTGTVVDDRPTRRARDRADAAGVPRRRAAGRARAGPEATDDAALVEAAGGRVVVVAGASRQPQGHRSRPTWTGPPRCWRAGRRSRDPRRARLRRPPVRRRRIRSCSAASTLAGRRRSSATPMPTSSPTPWPTRCSARSGSPTSARCSRRRTGSTAARPRSTCSPTSRRGSRDERLVGRERRRRRRRRAPRAAPHLGGHGGEPRGRARGRGRADGSRRPRVGHARSAARASASWDEPRASRCGRSRCSSSPETSERSGRGSG